MYILQRIYNRCTYMVRNVETLNKKVYSKRGQFSDLSPYNTSARSIVLADNKLKRPGQRSGALGNVFAHVFPRPGWLAFTLTRLEMFSRFTQNMFWIVLNQALAVPDSNDCINTKITLSQLSTIKVSIYL